MISQICVLFVAANSLLIVDAASTKRSPDDLPIKYPGPVKVKDVNNRYGTSEDLPEQCKGKNYCTVKPADYPQELFDAMFKDYKPLAQPSLETYPDIGNRQGDPDEVDNCKSEVTFEPLYKVRPSGGDYRTVVQAENFVQKVRLETCSEPDAACFTFFPSVAGYTTFCKQKYNVWKVQVWDGKNGTETIQAELPVCCSCHYKSDLGNRFGKPKN